jgi:hypothetical protein
MQWNGIRTWDNEAQDAGARTSAEPRRVSMPGLGRGGRWGNSLLAYFFLKAFADVHGMAPEVPRWIGQDLFGWVDDPVTQHHPVILYDKVSEICQDLHHPMVTASLAAIRARAVLEARGCRLFLLRDPLLSLGCELPGAHLELEGPCLLHTKHLAPHRALLRGAVEPVPVLRRCVESGWQDLRSRGDIVIGLHVRGSDFVSKFVHQGFEFVTPMQWYRSWLDRLWVQHRHPVLFVSSDSMEQVLPALARYRPITSRELGIDLPSELRRLDLPPTHLQRDAAFFADWYLLTRCQAIAISNSTFSFTASMLNETASIFMRPDPGARALVPFDPWNSEPLLFLPPAGNLLLEVLRRFSLVQRGLGVRATIPNLKRALDWYRRILWARAQASRQLSGRAGLARELLRPQFYLAACRRYDEDASGTPEAKLPVVGRSRGVWTPQGQQNPLSSRRA